MINKYSKLKNWISMHMRGLSNGDEIISIKNVVVCTNKVRLYTTITQELSGKIGLIIVLIKYNNYNQ